MKLFKELKEIRENYGVYTPVEPGDINYLKTPVYSFSLTHENVEIFNRIYFYYLDFLDKGLYHDLEFSTQSIKVGRKTFHPPAVGVKTFSDGAEIMVIDSKTLRIQIRSGKKGKSQKNFHTGKRCYTIFTKIAKEKFGIDIEKYFIPNGEDLVLSKQIKEPPRKMYSRAAGTQYEYLNAYHLDLNSSYPSGIADAFPELRPVFEYLYNRRKTNPFYKDVLTHITGFFMCDKLGYKLAHLAKAGKDWTIQKVEQMADRLRKAKYVPISCNVDGIWYTGKNEPYHDEEEGVGLGKWKNDHVHCRIRFKSAGSYEYIENGIYTPVVSGLTELDRIKDRRLWEWGDIMREELTSNEYRWFNREGFKPISIDDIQPWEYYYQTEKEEAVLRVWRENNKRK